MTDVAAATKADIEKLTAAIQAMVESQSTMAKAQGDNFTKESMMSVGLVVAILTAVGAGVWNFSEMNSRISQVERAMVTREDLTELTVSVSELKSTVLRLEDFSRAPRFTREDFNAEMGTIRADVVRHDDMLRARGQWMDDTTQSLREMEFRIQTLERAIEE